MAVFLLVGGYAKSLLNFRGELLAALIDKGFAVHAAAPGLGPHTEEAKMLSAKGVIAHDIPISRTGLNPLADFQTLFLLLRLMLKIQPDFFMGYTIKPVVYGLLAAFFARVHHRYALITGVGYMFLSVGKNKKMRFLGWVVRNLYRVSLLCANKVFFQNKDDRNLFDELRITRKSLDLIVVNGSGVDLNHYCAASVSSGCEFLMIARLLKSKGVREYVEAAKILKIDFPEITFALAGWLDEGPDSISSIELDGWVRDGVIKYLGRLDDVRPALIECSVFVLPSYREGTPRSVLEAMAIGRAIITTDAPGCRETVEIGVNGLLVPVGSTQELSEAMRQMILDPEMVRNFGTASRRIAEKKYDVHSVNKMMLEGMGLQ